MLDYWKHLQDGCKVTFYKVPIPHFEDTVTYAVHILIECKDGNLYNEVFTRESVNLEICNLKDNLEKIKKFKKEAINFINSGKESLEL